MQWNKSILIMPSRFFSQLLNRQRNVSDGSFNSFLFKLHDGGDSDCSSGMRDSLPLRGETKAAVIIFFSNPMEFKQRAKLGSSSGVTLA
jgi:hypothetical protein